MVTNDLPNRNQADESLSKSETRYRSALDNMVDLVILRKFGNGYIFTHRMLIDYFATFDDHSAQ
jgi:hypothetical protein